MGTGPTGHEIAAYVCSLCCSHYGENIGRGRKNQSGKEERQNHTPVLGNHGELSALIIHYLLGEMLLPQTYESATINRQTGESCPYFEAVCLSVLETFAGGPFFCCEVSIREDHSDMASSQ